jgi:hypothetical protein
MSSEFTPSTNCIRQAYVHKDDSGPSARMVAAAEFDRWLAAHDRQIAEKTRLSYQWHPSPNLLRSTLLNSKNLEDLL